MAAGSEAAAAAHVLVGPTASGKSAVAHLLAVRRGAGILSADALLVYRGLDIGTAKPAAAERAAVRYWGLDLVSPAEVFSVAVYLRHAAAALSEAAAVGLPLIVVGGTGLYVKALTEGLEPGPSPDPARRAEWERVWRAGGVAALQAALCARAPALYAELADPGNPRRLIRALERAEAGAVGRGAGGAPAPWRAARRPAVLVGLRWPPAALAARIEARVRAMYAAGLLEEVEGLAAAYGTLSATAASAIGYAEALEVLRGRCGREEAMARTAARTRQLAKRQRTWFRGQADVDWVDAEPGMGDADLAERVEERWERHGPARIVVKPGG